MRHLVRLTAAWLVGLTACQSDSAQNDYTDPDQSPAAAVATSQSAADLARHFNPIIAGVWVQASYLDAVARSRSPYRVADTLGHITELHIQPAPDQTDSLVVGLSLGGHEGGELSLLYRPARHAQALPVRYPDYREPRNYYELSYRIGAHDTVLWVNHYNPADQPIPRVAYRRVRLPVAQQGNLGAGLAREVNRLLMAGRYVGTDSAGRAVALELTAEGGVSGLGRFQQYRVGTDFTVAIENNLDLLEFRAPTGPARWFTYRISPDTLRLYALKADSNHVDLHPARLQYTLVRRR